ncbi:MAG: acyltransferase, partial [Bacteroidetes bacterium]
MAVMVSHWLPESPLNHLPLGRMGVDIFFVISGFLITGILLEGREKAAAHSGSRWQVWRNFFIRRVLRLFPLYYVTLLLLVLFNPKAIMPGLPWHLTYTSNYYIISADKWPGIVSHLWSLAVEEHFYLVWPFLILFLPQKRILPAILTVLAGGVLFRLYLLMTGGTYISTYISTPSCADALAMGGLLAWMWRYRQDSLHKLLHTAWFPLITLLLSGLSMACKSYELPLWGIYIVLFRLCFSAFCFWIVGK